MADVLGRLPRNPGWSVESWCLYLSYISTFIGSRCLFCGRRSRPVRVRSTMAGALWGVPAGMGDGTRWAYRRVEQGRGLFPRLALVLLCFAGCIFLFHAFQVIPHCGHLILPAAFWCLLRLFLEQFDQCSQIMLDGAGEGIQGGQQVLYSGALDLEAAFRERDGVGKGIDSERRLGERVAGRLGAKCGGNLLLICCSVITSACSVITSAHRLLVTYSQ